MVPMTISKPTTSTASLNDERYDVVDYDPDGNSTPITRVMTSYQIRVSKHVLLTTRAFTTFAATGSSLVDRLEANEKLNAPKQRHDWYNQFKRKKF
jgi:hypothetical protein